MARMRSPGDKHGRKQGQREVMQAAWQTLSLMICRGYAGWKLNDQKRA